MVEIIEVNGKQVRIKPSISRFQKTSFQISEDIYRAFARIGIERKFIDLQLSRNPLRRGESAQIGWVVNGKDMYYQCNTQERYVDNLGVIGKVIEQECYSIRNGMKSFGQVMNQFRLEFTEGGEKTKSPREILGIDANMKDFDYITFRYKQKLKEFHPDMPGGDTEKTKQLNEAYNQLKKELGL